MNAPNISKPVEGITGTRNIKLQDIVNNCNAQDTNNIYVKWIRTDQLLYSTPTGYTVNDLKNNVKYKLKVIRPLPSPDGKYMAYMKKTEQVVKLYLLNLKTKKAIKLMQEKTTNDAEYSYRHFSKIKYIWTPDSKILIIDNVVNGKAEIYITTIESKILKPLLFTIIDIEAHSITWGFNNNIIFFDYHWTNDTSSIYNLNLETKKLSEIIKFDSLQNPLVLNVSPDGQKIALIYDDESGGGHNYMSYLGIISIDNYKLSKVPNLSKIASLMWMDSNTLIVSRDYGPYNQLYSINLLTNKIVQLTNESFSIGVYDVLNNIVAYLGHDIYGRTFIKTIDITTDEINDVSCVPLLKNVTFGKSVEIGWNGTFENMRGLLLLPNNYEPNKKYGLIVDIHGGGPGATMYLDGSILRYCPLELHLWTSYNYIVFLPEFRSSGIYGSNAITVDFLKNKNIIDCDVKDIESGVDYLISKKIVDENKIIAIGGSAGAHIANWLPVVSQRYKAIVSVEGWNEPEMDDDNPRAQKLTPLAHIDKVKTPMLFIMGNTELGGHDHQNLVIKYYDELKKRNVYTQHVYIPDEGHVFEKKENVEKIVKKVLSWILEFI